MVDFINQISLLYVDDEAILLESTKRYLEHIGDFIVDTASSAKEGLKKIQEREYDAVVSDYQMPVMDGLAFLRTLRAEGNPIPFIIFTGRGREEVAIEALNAGADYYLQKGGKPKVQFGELQNFIRQAVEKSRAEKKLLEHEQRMADIINFLPDATFAIDTEGRVIAWSRAIEEMTGISASEMLGKSDYEYALPFYGRRRPILIDLVLHSDLRREVSYPVLDGKNRNKLCAEIFSPHLRGNAGAHLWFTASPLYNADGNIAGAIESIRDVTDYKQTEGLYQTVFENTGTAMLILEEDNSISYVNEEIEKGCGYSREELEGRITWPELIAEEDRERMLEYHHLRQTDSDSAPKNYECRLIHKNGETRTVDLTAATIPGTKKTIFSLKDITGQKEAEKQLKFTQFTADHAPEGIFWADTNGRFFSVNESAIDMFGYSREELLRMSVPDFAQDFPPKRFREYWDEIKEKGSLTFETRIAKKDGESVTVEISVVLLNFEGQEYGCGFVRDVSERKKTEEAVVQTKRNLEAFFNTNGNFFFVLDEQGCIVNVNETVIRCLGYTKAELLGQRVIMVHPPEQRDEAWGIVQDMLAGTANFSRVPIMTKAGHLIPVEITVTRGEWDGKPVIFGVCKDISQLKLSEEKFSAAFHSSAALMAISTQQEGIFIEVNGVFLQTLGYSRDEIIGKRASDLNLFAFQEDRIHALCKLEEEREVRNLEIPVIAKNGDVLCGLFSVDSIMVGDTPCLLTTMVDITGRKNMEDRLRSTQERLELAMDAGEHGFWDWNLDTNEIYFSPRYYSMLGYDPGELPMQLSTWVDLIHPDDREQVVPLIREYVQNARPYEGVFRLRSKDGAWKWISGSVKSYEVDDGGIPHRAVGVHMDISDRKKLEDTLIQTRRNYETIFNANDDFLFVIDEQGCFLDVNETVARRLGYTREELLGQTVLMVHQPECACKIEQMVREMVAGTTTFSKVSVMTRDGHLIPVEVRVGKGEWNGKPAIFGVSKDISLHKLSEEIISAAFHSSAALMTLSTQQDGVFIEANETFLRTLGFSRDEVIGKVVTEMDMFVFPEDWSDALGMLEKEGAASGLEIQVISKGGDIRYGLFSLNSLMIDGTPCILTTMIDITARKIAENAIKTLNNKLNLLSSITRHDIINQLSVVMTYGELLNDEIGEENVRVYLQPMIEATEMIEHIITFTRDYQDLGVHSPTWQSVESVAHSVASQISAINIEVKTDTGTLEIFADPMLNKVFYNLFENAARHGRHVSDISVSFHEKEDCGIVVIEDNGVGVAGNMKEKIFRRGVGSNTGFGLFLSRDVLNITGISISETGTEGNGARFEIAVPKGFYRFGD